MSFLVKKKDEVSLVNINDNEKWDRIVKSFSNHDVFYLNGYAKACQIHGEGEPFLFYYNGGTTRAISVLIKRDIAQSFPFKDKIPEKTWFDISSPYGYGGFLIEGDDYKSVNDVFNDYCKEQGYISEFVRFGLFNGSWLKYSGSVDTYSQNIVRDLDMPLDSIVADFEYRVKKGINKALRSGVKIQRDQNGDKLRDFLEIYYSTLNRNNAESIYYFSEDFFKTINLMEGNFIYIHAFYEGKIISTELVLYGVDTCYSFLGGTDRKYFHLNANTLLKYEVIRWAKEIGLKRFVLGGGHGANDGIFKYKRGFAPSGVYDFYVGKKIIDESKYRFLVELRKTDEHFNSKALFFPLYRA